MKKNFLSNDVQKLKPYGKRVLIKKEEKQNLTDGGLYLPNLPDELEDRGLIVELGPLVKDFCPELKKGDHVLLDRFHLNDLENPNYKLIDCDFIWGVIEEETKKEETND